MTYVLEILGHCKGGNFNIHIWAWFDYFICLRKEIRNYHFGKELISCWYRANVCAFYENPDRIYNELTFINPLSAITKKSYAFVVC